MSIANLLVSNSYDLYARSLTLTNDVAKTTRLVDLYNASNTANVIASDVPLYYVVRDGIATLWMNTSATYNIGFNCTTVYIADVSTGYVTIPCPDVPGEKLSQSIQVRCNNNVWFRSAFVEIDCSVGPNEGQGRLAINLDPSFTVGGGPTYTNTVVTGSDQINTTFGLFGWSISYPVEGLV